MTHLLNLFQPNLRSLWMGSAGTNNNIKVDDKGNYGVRAGISPGYEMLKEFEWNHTKTTLQWYDIISNETFREDGKMNYYMLGLNKEMSDGPAIPFGVVNVGVMNLKAQKRIIILAKIG